MSVIKEFKEFISRGSVIDLAVGVVIGGAFTSIVNSLVEDIIMPPLGYLLAGVDFSNMKAVLQPATDGAEEVAIRYGSFIQAVISFLLIALVIFFVVKGINRLRDLGRKKDADEAAVEVVAPTEVELLTEILGELRAQK